MSESTLPWMKPCHHAEPQGASQLHGVCIFCYRDRLADAERRAAMIPDTTSGLRDRVAQLETALRLSREVVDALASKFYTKLNEWKYNGDFGHPRYVVRVIDAALSRAQSADEKWLLESAAIATQATATKCHVSMWSSRVCARGTKACIDEHIDDSLDSHKKDER